MRLVAALACAFLALTSCTTHRLRSSEVAEVDERSHWLPSGAAPGMFITWTNEQDSPEPEDAREETLACVGEIAELVTMERRETLWGGSTRVTATRFRRDGTLVDAWRGPKDGVGRPLRVNTKRTDWKAAAAEADRARTAQGLPPPSVSASRSTEWVDTPAGRISCVRNDTKVSMLFLSVRGTSWYAVTPLPLSSLVKSEVDGPVHVATTLKAFGWNGAAPTLSIPVDGR